MPVDNFDVICDRFERALTDDKLVDEAATVNLDIIRSRLAIDVFMPKMRAFYARGAHPCTTRRSTAVAMKVLQVNSSDIIGSRFNGFDIRGLLADQGIKSHHLVWNKISKEAASSRFFDVPGSRLAMQILARVERFFSIHSRLQWQSFLLPLHREFREADVVHYHILHDGYFSLDALPMLSRLKPTVWTLHDQWPLTGHCIYPLGCERWRSGCGACRG